MENPSAAPSPKRRIEDRITKVLKQSGKHATVRLHRVEVLENSDGTTEEQVIRESVCHLERLGKGRWRNQLTGRPIECDLAAS